ncbi:hypothetical protein C8R46DRAFT_1024411 [Mycena filopes]|nr:hypothetical protein C8R46DRAFT_1024411 [Mycena filopes]
MAAHSLSDLRRAASELDSSGDTVMRAGGYFLADIRASSYRESRQERVSTPWPPPDSSNTYMPRTRLQDPEWILKRTGHRTTDRFIKDLVNIQQLSKSYKDSVKKEVSVEGKEGWATPKMNPDGRMNTVSSEQTVDSNDGIMGRKIFEELQKRWPKEWFIEFEAFYQSFPPTAMLLLMKCYTELSKSCGYEATIFSAVTELILRRSFHLQHKFNPGIKIPWEFAVPDFEQGTEHSCRAKDDHLVKALILGWEGVMSSLRREW